ncbi:MAG: Fic family protein [Fusobacteriaceae bacterium]
MHPFADGNGRTGRLIINYLLIENNIPPLVLPQELKGDYIYSLANQDVNKLFKISKLLIKKEKEKIYCFSNKL